MMEKSDRIHLYQQRYAENYGFEAVMVESRRKLILEMLRSRKPETVLEVGCGLDSLYVSVDDPAFGIKKWVIVEPAEKFANEALARKYQNIECHVILDFVEDALDQIRRIVPSGVDMVICSGVLHEVPAPEKILNAVRQVMKDHESLVHVNVPNAGSFHRRLAVAMGLIQNEKEMSERNTLLSQFRVYDSASLDETITKARFRVVERGGYLIKPFSHKQMEAMGNILSERILEGLWLMGRQYPELASEIYVNAVPD